MADAVSPGGIDSSTPSPAATDAQLGADAERLVSQAERAETTEHLTDLDGDSDAGAESPSDVPAIPADWTAEEIADLWDGLFVTIATVTENERWELKPDQRLRLGKIWQKPANRILSRLSGEGVELVMAAVGTGSVVFRKVREVRRDATPRPS